MSLFNDYTRSLIKKYVKVEVIPMIKKNMNKEDQNISFLNDDIFNRELKRHFTTTENYLNTKTSNREIKTVIRKFHNSRYMQYLIEFEVEGTKYSKCITPQNLHMVGKFTLCDSNYICIKCEFYGKYKQKMKNAIKLNNNINQFNLEIRFGKKHFNDYIPHIWDIKKRLNAHEYHLVVYQDIDNNLIFQMSNSNNKHIVGCLNPIKGKWAANFFKNILQIDINLVNKLNKMVFY